MGGREPEVVDAEHMFGYFAAEVTGL